MRKRKHYKLRYFDFVFNAKVLEILELHKSYENQTKLKTAFKYESVTGEKLCIYWGNRICLEIGDTVNLKGRYKEDIFLAESVLIIKGAKHENSNNISDFNKPDYPQNL